LTGVLTPMTIRIRNSSTRPGIDYLIIILIYFQFCLFEICIPEYSCVCCLLATTSQLLSRVVFSP
jgi:hypothetical protein